MRRLLPIGCDQGPTGGRGRVAHVEAIREGDGVNAAPVAVLAVGNGVVVVAVAVAVVLVVFIVALSLRGRQVRGAKRTDQVRQDLDEAYERAGRAERNREIAEAQTDRQAADES